MKIRKLLAAAFGCFALLFGTTAAHAAETAVAKIGETPYSSLNEAIKAVQTGETITLVSDIEINTAISGTNCTSVQEYTLDLNGKTISATAELGLSAYKADWGDVYEATGKINLYKPTRVTVKNGGFRSVGKSGRIRAEDGCSATIENVTFTMGDVLYGGSSSLADSKEGVCIFQGWQISDGEQNAYVFKNCSFTDCYVGIEGSSNCAASETEFTGCTFTLTGEKYIEKAVSINFSINGSFDFNDCAFDITNFAKSSSTTRSAVAIDSDARTEAGLSISLKDTTFTGTTNPKGGSVSLIDNSGELEKKTTTVALTGETSVTVDGTVVESPVPNAVASVNGTHYADLAAALNAAIAAKNATVEIVADITFADGDTWTPVKVGKNTTLVVNGNNKTITGLPGCLFGTTHESEMQTGSSLTMKNLKFVNPKVRVNKPKIYGDTKDYSFAAVILAEAYGMDATLEKVEIEGADVRGGDDCYTAGFVGWCNDKSSDPDAKHPVVKLQNCALRNSTIIGCGTAAGLVGHVAANETESVILIVTDCEVVNNTIVCTEEGKNNKAGAVVATVAAEGATVSAKVSGNKVYSGKGSLDDTDDTTWKTGTEITTVYGRRSGSGTLSLTGGTYDARPFNAGDDWAKVAKGYNEPTENDDGTWSVTMHVVAKVGDKEFNSLADALNAAITHRNADDVVVKIVDDIKFETGDTWTPVMLGGGQKLVIDGKAEDGSNHVIEGLSASLAEKNGSWQVLRVSNLTFKSSKVTGTVENMGTGVVLGMADSMLELTFDNVVIDGANVLAVDWAGAFVGYAAGYSDESNGAVFQTVTFRNCKVLNSTVKSSGSVGALIGHASGSTYTRVVVENAEICDNVIECTRENRAGAVFGTVGEGQPTAAHPNGGLFVDANVSGNTVTSDGQPITTIYGRRGNDSSTGTLTLTGGSYDKRPFNEGDDWAKLAEWSKFDEFAEKDGVFKVVDNLATLGNVKARQRYPWNGLVDITFELKSKNAARVFLVAEYVDGGETKRLPMAEAKLVNDDKSESDVNVSTGFTVPAQATAKTIHVIWDSTAAVPTRLSGVTFKVYAK